MIELCHVTKTFVVGKASRFTAVDDVSLTIEPGKITVLKGPSGSGKTSLLTLIGCMARPTSGRIRLHGFGKLAEGLPDGGELDISSLPERFLTTIRRASFGFIFQQFNLIRGISVLENVMLPAYPTVERHAAVARRAHQLLDHFNLSRQVSSKVEWLSGGEMQRVAIARALINQPAVIIADEPTAHLDTTLSADFLETMVGLRGEGKTIIIASHDPLICDSPLIDRAVEMRDGRLVTAAA